jgi:hypothetical protein
MKFFFAVALVLAVAFSQFGPPVDPTASKCKATSWCAVTDGLCSLNQTYYCTTSDYCVGANTTVNGLCKAKKSRWSNM